MQLAKQSVQSLLLKPLANGKELSTATGFVVMHESKPYLITNWHVVSGRNPKSGQPLHESGAIPDALQVSLLRPPSDNGLLWEARDEALFDVDGKPRWLEHPALGRKVDAVALELQRSDGFDLHPYPLTADGPDLRAAVSDFVNVIGFPFGVTAGGRLAVWTKAGIATEPEINFDELPCFLIDARTRQGQSGSPVVAYAAPGAAALLSDGSTAFYGAPLCKLLGVYSGRMREDSDLGFAWKTEAINAILKGGAKGNGDFREAQP